MESLDFLNPYLKAAGFDADKAATPVFISSADVYLPAPGEWLDEDAPVDTSSPWFRAEQEFIDSHRGKAAVVLRCAPIVGTGMTGRVRRLAEDIWRGTFFHFPLNDARMSVVHATDVARAAKALADTVFDAPGIYVFNLADSTDPALRDLAEALAFRMDNKRISTLSTKPQQWLGKLLYGRRKYEGYTRPQLIRAVKIKEFLPFTPVDVCAYLRTHTYDENSL